ncbi:uncharacterized protein B0P05DRAFT_592567 [Gilbertella persicaria]|uniref:uncharacterized protein n=1 Tax=Gilbertella persicaria TaxID=101096 RepID=UPI00221F8196|nr:uncharacterized protein B0P05DRAFT_592567 [Gilbertella persicaria]KAI8047564.1 hypothetical protein B0P05DRAFT_592567 [Gilbertella persicaria]
MPEGAGFSLFPYQYVSSRVIAAAAAVAASSSSSSYSSSTSAATLLQSPSYFGHIVLQFTRQVMRPKVVLPMLFVIVLLFDLDGSLDIDDEFFLEESNENNEQNL